MLLIGSFVMRGYAVFDPDQVNKVCMGWGRRAELLYFNKLGFSQSGQCVITRNSSMAMITTQFVIRDCMKRQNYSSGIWQKIEEANIGASI